MLKAKMDCLGFLTILLCLTLSACAQSESIDDTSPSSKENEALSQLGFIQSDSINESSGLIESKNFKGHFWTMNDSGKSILYLISAEGETRATVDLKDAKNVDWESLAWKDLNNQRRIYIGDVGDNPGRRKSVQIYILDEPKIKLKKSKAQEVKLQPEKIEFTYADGPRNCEAMAVVPSSDELWLIEKGYTTDPTKLLGRNKLKMAGIYSLSLRSSQKNTKREQVAQRIGDLSMLQVTGMDFSPDGKMLIVRNYLFGNLFFREAGKSWLETIKTQSPTAIAFPIQLQGESVCFTNDSLALVITSEGNNQPIWQVGLSSYLKKHKRGQSSDSAQTDPNNQDSDK